MLSEKIPEGNQKNGIVTSENGKDSKIVSVVVSKEEKRINDQCIPHQNNMIDGKSQFYLKVNQVQRAGSDSQLQTPVATFRENFDSQECFPLSPLSFSSDDTNNQKCVSGNDGNVQKPSTFFADYESYLTKATQRFATLGAHNDKQHSPRKINKPVRISFQHLREDAASIKSASDTHKKSSKRMTQENWPPHSSPKYAESAAPDQSASTRRSSASEFVGELHEAAQLQRWRNKTHSQAISANPRYQTVT